MVVMSPLRGAPGPFEFTFRLTKQNKNNTLNTKLAFLINRGGDLEIRPLGATSYSLRRVVFWIYVKFKSSRFPIKNDGFDVLC